MPKNLDMARMLSTTLGSGSVITLDAVVPGFISWEEAGAIDGDEVYAAIEQSSSNIAMLREVGLYRYNTSPPRATRLQVYKSTNAGAAISLEGAAEQFSSPLAEGMGGAPGGLDTQIQINDNGAFGADADFTWVSGLGLTAKQHVAFGNFAAIDNPTYEPGWGGSSSQSFPSSLILNDYFSGDLSGVQFGFATIWGGIKHTGVGSTAGINALDFEPVVNNDSTGPISAFSGIYCAPANYGSGNLGSLFGFTSGIIHAGSGTVAVSASFDDNNTYLNGIIGTAYGYNCSRPNVAGSTITNRYGISIADQSSIGLTASYNIFSAGTSFVTPSTRVGGNLFQTHVAIGNYSDVDKAYYVPGDPVNEVVVPGSIPLLINEKFSGALTTTQRGAAIYTGLKHTGLAAPVYYGWDIGTLVNSDSTGPLAEVDGIALFPINFGSGHIDVLAALNGYVAHQGSGTVGTMAGLSYGMDGTGGGTVSDGRTILALAPAGGTFTKLIGLTIGHHAIGTAASYNLLSGGNSFITPSSTAAGNLFQTHVAVGNYADVDKVVFAPGDPISVFPTNEPYTFIINEYLNGDFSGQTIGALAYAIGVKHTGVGAVQGVLAQDFEPWINSDSTGPINRVWAAYVSPANDGSGAISELIALETAPAQYGSGIIGSMYDILVGRFNASNPATVNNYYGVYVADHAGGGGTTAYNILSKGTSFITPASTAGGNLFQGHVAIGNYADVDKAIYAAGDTGGHSYTFPASQALVISDYKTGDLSGLSLEATSVYPSYRHTGATNAYAYGIDSSPVINTNSTGPFYYSLGGWFGPTNYGSGNVTRLTGAVSRPVNRGGPVTVLSGLFGGADNYSASAVSYIRGLEFVPYHGGTGTVGDMTGVDVDLYQDTGAGAITTMYGVNALLEANGVVGSSYGLRAKTVKYGGAAFTNAYGLYIDDHSAIGGTASYNILSKGTSFITPSSKVGGNLFQAHTAIGNFADVDTLTFPPTAGGTVYTGSFPLVVVDKTEGDLSALAYGAQLVTAWGGYKHTGIGTPTVCGIDVETFILSDSTGPFYQSAGLQFVGENRGSGNVGSLMGASMAVKHSGSGTVGFFAGIYMELFRQSGGPVTDSYGIYIDYPYITGPAAAWGTNTGLYIAPQSSVGTSQSYNILSAGTSFITPSDTSGGNLFQGHMAVGNYADVDAAYFFGFGGGVSGGPNTLNLSDKFSGDLSGSLRTGLVIYSGFSHTGASGAFLYGNDIEPVIMSTSTGPVDQFHGANFFPLNEGSGNITDTFIAFDCFTEHEGSGTVAADYGFRAAIGGSGAGVVTQGATAYLTKPFGSFLVTSLYGLYIEDHSGIGSSVSENIRSKGASSLTKFEGHHYQGNYYETTEVTAPSAPPANGVRIYAEDNGAGKTRLMALFNTGAAQQIAIQP